MLVGGGDAEGFHFAVEVGAFQADGGGGLRHVPAIFLEFAQDKFAFVGAAGFVQRAVGLLRAFDDAAKKFGRQMVRLDADLRADDDQALDEIAQFAHVSGPGIAQQNFQSAVAEFARFFAVSGAEFIEEMTSEDWECRQCDRGAAERKRE